MSENKDPLSPKAAEALAKSSYFPLMGPSVQIERILSKRDAKGKPAPNHKSPKLLQAKMAVLTTLIRQHNLAKTNQVDMSRIVGFAIEHL